MGNEYINSNLDIVHEKINASIVKANRTDDSISLISVSKTKPIEDLLTAYKYGERDFGENKVQELIDKYELMPKDARFHMIGHLQKNKVKYLIGKTVLIHGVDSYELAKVIEKECIKHEANMDILIEVNVAKEDTKYGLHVENVLDEIKKISLLPHVHIKGLMTIAPYVDDPELNRQYFVALRELSIDIKRQNIDNVSMDILSMGMTGDYQVAIEEGATYVRVGTGIFGERNYNI